jgi:hypothetical protein
MAAPKPEDVRAELEKLYTYRRFRGAKLRRLLGFLVEEWLKDEGENLSEMYIGGSLQDEPLTLEEITRKSDKPGEKTGEKWGYPKTRANLGHVRNRLRKYYEIEGYRDPVIIKLNPGSYAPVIAYNSVSTAMPDLPPEVARLILRAKTAIDGRTLRGAWRALRYYLQIPQDLGNTRRGKQRFHPHGCRVHHPQYTRRDSSAGRSGDCASETVRRCALGGHFRGGLR